ncbi:class IV adenylate cyclase [Archaeoglobus profundus]|uniref:Adenylyl cyclase CyaB n=1 Tax=Archaeoglobus profundus (strain DSM 5631 / JCM 9629 / NBRC 100127 / Av18) TaxID=572546 RepID=D2RFK0_ARCPA|nr:class IV adenylate cyclase [Archaeoglobus profundus]ADB58894.1 adenylyl cyclase CyaB [Archaeoglobus profundus DSM 5631]
MEVEVKFRLEENVKRKIEEVAEFVCEVCERDIYFNHPCRDFLETDEALRVRKSEKVFLTYKGPKIDRETKTREEIEVEISDFDKAVEIMKKLGFKPVAEVFKVRRIYRMGDATICIDNVKDLGGFVEIEIKSENVEEAKRLVFKIADKFGLRNPITKSYLEMLLENKR